LQEANNTAIGDCLLSGLAKKEKKIWI
jgi:hypothetical protein